MPSMATTNTRLAPPRTADKARADRGRSIRCIRCHVARRAGHSRTPCEIRASRRNCGAEAEACTAPRLRADESLRARLAFCAPRPHRARRDYGRSCSRILRRWRRPARAPSIRQTSGTDRAHRASAPPTARTPPAGPRRGDLEKTPPFLPKVADGELRGRQDDQGRALGVGLDLRMERFGTLLPRERDRCALAGGCVADAAPNLLVHRQATATDSTTSFSKETTREESFARP